MSHWITMKKLMKLNENLSENSLWVKDVMRTLSYTYWTNVILQNDHFLTPFLTLFRQNFFRFLDFLIFFGGSSLKSDLWCAYWIVVDEFVAIGNDIWSQTSGNATPLFGPRLLFGTLFWWITIVHNMAKQKIVIFLSIPMLKLYSQWWCH